MLSQPGAGAGALMDDDKQTSRLPWRIVRAGVIGVLIGAVVAIFSHLAH